MPDDAELLSRFVESGDRTALGALVRRYRDPVYDFVRRILRDEGRAEDVTQDTFVRLLQAAGGWRGDGSVRSWIFSVALNTSRNARRGADRRERHELAAGARPTASVDPPEEAAMRAELRAAVDALPEELQVPVILHFYRGLTHEEVAAATACPRGTVATRIRRAKERLRHSLGALLPAATAVEALLAGAEPAAAAPAELCVRLDTLVASAIPASAAAIGLPMLGRGARVGFAATALVLCVAGGLGAWALSNTADRSDTLNDADGQAASTPSDTGPPAALPHEGGVSDPDGRSEEPSRAGDAARRPIPVRRVGVTPDGGTVEILVRWADGKPAADAWVSIVPFDGPDPFLHQAELTTSADGVARVEGLRAGMAVVYLHLGRSKRCTIRAGETLRLELTIPRTRAVSGVVVGVDGRPIAGAQVWLSRVANWGRGYVVATTDVRGAFELPSVQSHHYIAARAAGHGPARLEQLGVAAEGARRVRLVLRGDGGRVTGRVRDVDGHPLHGVKIVVEDGPDDWQIPPVTLETDVTGRFEAVGIAAGSARLRARTPGLAVWERKVIVRAGTSTDVEIRLDAGGTLEGIVRDDVGRPVPGAAIQIGEGWDLASSRTKSDDAGRFRLTGVAPGAVRATASLRGHGTAARELQVAVGAVTTWEPTLAAGRRVVGRVTDGAGNPRSGWNIHVDDDRSGHADQFHGRAATDDRGEFVIVNCPKRELRVLVCDPAQPIYACRVLIHVHADGKPLDIRIPDAHRARGSVRAEVVDADSRPIGQATVHVWKDGQTMSVLANTDSQTGRFHVRKLPPGRYRIEVLPQHGTPMRLGVHELGPAQHLDLGVVRRAVPGFVVLELSRADGEPLTEGAVYRMNAAGQIMADRRVPARLTGRVVRCGPLAPGRHRLHVSQADCRPVEIEVQVRSGEDTTHRVRFERADR